MLRAAVGDSAIFAITTTVLLVSELFVLVCYNVILKLIL
jgi:hypothetical protein